MLINQSNYHKINTLLKIIDLENSLQPNLSPSNRHTNSSYSWKEKIKAIPYLGQALWYLYMILMAPKKICHIYSNIERNTADLNSLRYEISKLNSQFAHISSIMEENKNLSSLKSRDLPYHYELDALSELFPQFNLENEIVCPVENLSGAQICHHRTFRGANIKEHFKKFIPYLFEVYHELGGHGFFVDLGCGEGEFLELLQENGLPGLGLELNKQFAEELSLRGLNVLQGSLFDFLGSQAEKEEFLGIILIHLIEHFPPEKTWEILKLCHKRLRKGGLILIETPNPKSPIAHANFYMDWTHIRPYPHELLIFLLQITGFIPWKLILSSPADPAFRLGHPFADYMDYAILARKK